MSVVASLYGESTSELVAALHSLRERRSMVELRLDRIGSQVDLAALARAAGELNFLLACVPRDQGGEFDGDQAEWQELLLRAVDALPQTQFVDVPPQFDRPADLLQSIRVVWSWHAIQGSTDSELCRAALSKARSRAQRSDVIKLVSWAETHQQAIEILVHYQDWPENGPSLLAFAQGPGSRACRLFALSMGAPWAYCAFDGRATAPGQWSESELPSDCDWPSVAWFGVLGQPVEHSRSPLLWNCAFRWHAMVDSGESQKTPRYLALEHASLDRFHQNYAADCFTAFSVTSPLKQAAYTVADDRSVQAKRIGAANWLKREEGGGWRAHSTDGGGAMRALEHAGLSPDDAVWILGAGGAARAVCAEAIERGHQVTVVARRPDVAQASLSEFGSAVRIVDWSEAALPSEQSFALVNATPIGFHSETDDPCASWFIPSQAKVLDMIYQPVETALLKRARLAGARVVHGHRMLLEQMRLQFADLCGEEPPAGLLQLALEADLGIAQPSLALIGPRASGKSTLGRMLARVLGWDFIDADDELQRRTGKSIVDWVQHDQAGFRGAEAELLVDLLARPNAVLALGGGVVETPQACSALEAHSRVIALQISCEEQLARRRDDHRPALTAAPLDKEIEFLQQKRASLYEKASSGRCVNVEGLTTDAFRRLAESLNLYW